VATGTGLVQALDTGNGDPLWSWQVPTAEPRFTPYVRRGPTTLTSPAVSADRVWVGGADGALYGLHPREGSLQAWADLGAPIAAAPIVSGQRMWVGTTDGAVHGLTFD
jgi:outer membrane protein assembly factor BamB